MRLLVIAPFYRWFVKELVEAQSKYVSEIHVLVHHNPLAEISNYVPFGGYFDHLRLYTKQRIIDLRDVPPNVHVHLINTVYFIPDGRNPQLSEKLAKKFEEHIKRHNINFDIIHAHFTYPQGYTAVRLAQAFDVPVVVTLHENGPYLESVIQNVKEKAIYVWKNADMLIRVNKKDIRMFIKYGATPEKITYIPNGYSSQKLLHLPKTTARRALNLDKDSKILFNLSRLYPEKGHEYLIKAMYYILQERDDVLCYIGGTGPLYGKLKAQIKRLNLQSHIKLLGYIPDQELALWMNAADIFVFPSLNESFGVVVLEALAVGTPVVATINGGSENILISEDYGLLCKPKSPKDLAEKILIALNRDWDKEKIRQYASQFTWDNIAKQIFHVYSNLLRGVYGGEKSGYSYPNWKEV